MINNQHGKLNPAVFGKRNNRVMTYDGLIPTSHLPRIGMVSALL